MKEIQLSRGFVALVDDTDHEWLSGFNWNALVQKYKGTIVHICAIRTTKYPKRAFLMHREILGLTDRRILVDHIDGNALNNQRSNLRPCTHAENMRNSKSSIGSSKYKGVYWEKSRSRWVSKIKLNNRRINLGRFVLEKDAAIAYNEAAVIHHGKFARLNYVG